MSKRFLTNPSSPQSHLLSKGENLSWNFKEATVVEFLKLGVPLRPAELSVIDLKKYLILAFHNKLTPEQTANMMISEVERLYKRKDGSWCYSNEKT